MDGNTTREYVGAWRIRPASAPTSPGAPSSLSTPRIGSLGSGSPVFYRDIVVGEVLGYHLPEGNGPISVNLFVREPYDKWVRTGTHFWNASGLRVEFGGQGVHVQVASLQAVLSGGISFGTPDVDRDDPVAQADTTFRLYDDEDAANAAGFKQRIAAVAYLTTSASGLSVGSPVQIYGITVGIVTNVELQLDASKAVARVRVAMDIQPERLVPFGGNAEEPPDVVAQRLVDNGLRVELATSSYLTGSQVVSFEFPPNPEPAKIGHEGDAIVLPSQGGGGISTILSSLSDVAQKVQAIPFAQIGSNANALIGSLNTLVAGPEMKKTLSSVSATMTDVQGLVKHADAGLTPLLKRLPDMSNDLQQTLARTNRLVGSVDAGYGSNSQFSRDLERLMAQLNDTARSIRLLADFLDRHPESLIRGRTAQGAER